MTKDSKESTERGKLSSAKISKQQKDAPMLKVVIRCLPPTLTEDEFVKQVEPLSNHDFFCFVKADSSLGQYACSRAYINFLNQNDVVSFRDKWDGFPFKDTNGREYPAVVELSPYQKIPKKLTNRKPDPRCGTIEEDADYKKFLETLNSEIEPLPSAETYLEELEAKQRAAATARVTTPLIDFLKKKRIERIKAREKAREERRQKEKERKRQREEEKRRLEKERKKKREEKERREKEKLKEEVKSDEKKVREKEKIKEEDRKKGREAEKDSQIKLLKKTDKDGKAESEEKNKEQGKGAKSQEKSEQARGKVEAERKRSESSKSQENSSKDRDRHSSGRDRNNYPKSVNDKRRLSGRDVRERDRDADRNRDRGGGGGRDRYMERDRDRRPSRTSPQENFSKPGKVGSKEKLEGKDAHGAVDEKRADRKDEKPSGRGDVRGDIGGGEKDGGRKTTQETKKEEDKTGDRKEEKVKIRNKDRPDMARYQPGQRSWSSRTVKKEEGSDSARVSPSSSEGERPRVESSKPDTTTQKSTSATSVGGDAKKPEEKRPTAAKKFETQARNSSARYSGGREDAKSKPEHRSGDRNVRGGGRGYREERSMRNRQRQDDARRKAEEARNVKGPEKGMPTPAPEKKE